MSPMTLILLFLVIANLPWFTERFLLVMPLAENKDVFFRLIELVILYFVSLVIAVIFEIRFSGGGVWNFLISALLEPKFSGDDFFHQQGWEFIVITFCLFLVLSVPGVVYRYQWIPMNTKLK